MAFGIGLLILLVAIASFMIGAMVMGCLLVWYQDKSRAFEMGELDALRKIPRHIMERKHLQAEYDSGYNNAATRH